MLFIIVQPSIYEARTRHIPLYREKLPTAKGTAYRGARSTQGGLPVPFNGLHNVERSDHSPRETPALEVSFLQLNEYFFQAQANEATADR